MNKRTKIVVLIAVILCALAIIGRQTVFASQNNNNNKVTICHATGASTYNRIVVSENAIGGHFFNNGTPKAGHEDDLMFQGEVNCPGGASPSPSASASPSPSTSASPTPSPSASASPSPRVDPTPDPSVEPTPQPQSSVQNIGGGEAGAPQCPDTAPILAMANFHIYRNGDQAIVKWFPTEGNLANIYYKQVTSPIWQYSLTGVANDGYEVISGLGALDITFAGQQANGCAGGPLTTEVVDGPTDTWVLFR